MPIYEYECTACGQPHEALQKINAANLKICPACGKSNLQKKVSAAGFRLKGSGWYETDFKPKKKPSKDKDATSSNKKPTASKTAGNHNCASGCSH